MPFAQSSAGGRHRDPATPPAADDTRRRPDWSTRHPGMFTPWREHGTPGGRKLACYCAPCTDAFRASTAPTTDRKAA